MPLIGDNDSPPNDVRQLFQTLTTAWKRDCEVQSSPRRIAMHPSYQRIIALGAPALPLILHDLQNTGGPWFWALHAITGENPVPAEHAGFAEQMVDAWIAWGRQRSLI